jgi:hypothetical protein
MALIVAGVDVDSTMRRPKRRRSEANPALRHRFRRYSR